MGMSAIRDVYEAFARCEVVVRGAPVPCRSLDRASTAINRANLPVRILLPAALAARGEGRVLDAAGKGRLIAWTIPELTLVATASEGRGVEDAAELLIETMAAQEAALARRRFLWQAFSLTRVEAETGVFNWPAGSEAWYIGIRWQYAVEERVE